MVVTSPLLSPPGPLGRCAPVIGLPKGSADNVRLGLLVLPVSYPGSENRSPPQTLLLSESVQVVTTDRLT